MTAGEKTIVQRISTCRTTSSESFFRGKGFVQFKRDILDTCLRFRLVPHGLVHFTGFLIQRLLRIVTDKPDSPHLLANKINAELYLGFAEHDSYVEDFVIPDLTAALDANNVTYTLETHPGTEHGFCFKQRPSYDEPAASRVWEILFDLYKRTLN